MLEKLSPPCFFIWHYALKLCHVDMYNSDYFISVALWYSIVWIYHCNSLLLLLVDIWAFATFPNFRVLPCMILYLSPNAYVIYLELKCGIAELVGTSSGMCQIIPRWCTSYNSTPSLFWFYQTGECLLIWQLWNNTSCFPWIHLHIVLLHELEETGCEVTVQSPVTSSLHKPIYLHSSNGNHGAYVVALRTPSKWLIKCPSSCHAHPKISIGMNKYLAFFSSFLYLLIRDIQRQKRQYRRLKRSQCWNKS